MARKGSQQKNGVERQSINHKRRGLDSGGKRPEMKGRGKAREGKVFPGDELSNVNQPNSSLEENMVNCDNEGDEIRSKHDSDKFLRKEKQGMDGLEQTAYSHFDSRNCGGNIETPSVREDNGTVPGGEQGQHPDSSLESFLNVLHIKIVIEFLQLSENAMVRRLRELMSSFLKSARELLEQQRPSFDSAMTKLQSTSNHIRVKIKEAYPIVQKWLINVGNIIFLVSIIWLDCTVRGIDSFVRMGTSSFFSVIWCSIFSIIAMVGTFKFLMVMIVAALLGVFLGLTLAILVVAISGTAFLWLYGSFWTTAFVIFIGGLAFMLSHEQVALFITTSYSVYCAWQYVGWLGLLLGLNLSFISSDVLIYFLKNNMSENGRPYTYPQQTAGMQGQSGFFNDDPVHASSSETGAGLSSDRSAGIPSTSGTDSERTSEEEVVRLLKCTDHYSVLGLTRYETIDVSLLKREYRKKAMLVHPDKNMGNDKAAEAFKKLQNAYEILLDSLKQKAYDDELRREELLNLFRRFQSTSGKNGGRGFFPSGFGHPGTDSEDLLGESRRIVCKKCNNFHVWIHTRKPKSQARWCQDCKEFHQAKDGDGWVEQSSQPIIFGFLQKVDAPIAYVCADSKIYDATEWYICQGIRCPANSHKPSFHVNTSVTMKHNAGKGSNSGQRGGSNQMPTSNMKENMTEEEFLAWFQHAVQSSAFENFDGSTSTESPIPNNKSGGGGGSSSGTGNKRKKKGKKQW